MCMMYQQRFNPLSKFALLLSLCGAGIILSSIVTGLIGNTVLHVDLKNLAAELTKPENTQLSRTLQVITSFLIMAMPPLVMGKFTSETPIEQLGFRAPGNILQLGTVVLIIAAGFMLSGALGELNRLIPIPQNTAAYFQKLEDNYNKQVMSMGSMQSGADYFFSLIVLALVPAIFEEMLFRGALQQILITGTRSAFWGILITSIIFSAIHLSYYGFLPRLFLGMMLGYLLYYSKNIWMSIAAHFLNNAYALTGMYILSRQGKLTPESMNDTYPLYYGLIGALLIYFLFTYFKKESEKVLSKHVFTTPENGQPL